MSDNPFNPFIEEMAEQGIDVQITVKAPNPFLLPSQQQTSTEVVPTGKLRPDGTPYSTDRSERMRQLHEDGKMGPQFGKLGGARKRQHETAAKAVREMAAEEAEAIKQVFLDGIDEKQPISIRMAAAKEILKVEGEQVDRELRVEQADFDRQNKEQLAGNIVEMLKELSEAGSLAREVMELRDAEEIVDADVVQ